MACAPALAQRGLCGSGGDKVLRVEIGIANNPHRALHIVDGFPGDLEQTGGKIPGDPIILNRAHQTLIENSAVEAIAAAGMALDHASPFFSFLTVLPVNCLKFSVEITGFPV